MGSLGSEGDVPGLTLLAVTATGDIGTVEAVVRQYAWLLLGAALLGMLSHRTKVPYAVALVLAGITVAASGLVTMPALKPGILLFVFLPPLLFDAAFRIDAQELRLLLRPVLLLAIPGILVTALVVGGVLAVILGVSLTAGLLFGSIVAATDPVAVIGVFKQLKMPNRLAVIAEGESLINDGMAITLYLALIEVVVTGKADLAGSIGLFAREVVGGVLIGAILGGVFSRLTGVVDDHQVEMTLSTALAYGSYLIAQSVSSSGALACVAAGLAHGTYGRRVGMSATTRRLLDDLWEYLGFLANGLVFLLLGATVDLGSLRDHLWSVTVAVVAVLAARAVVVGLSARASTPGMGAIRSRRERAVLVWGGLRGALTAALALALPAGTPSRDLLVAMAFGVVLFTLVVQGLTLPVLIRRLGIVDEE